MQQTTPVTDDNVLEQLVQRNRKNAQLDDSRNEDDEEGDVKTSKLPFASTTTCLKCQKSITGQFVRALNAVYHLDCFNCLDCGEIVAAKFFPVVGPDGRQHPLCERDYFRRLGLVCHSCGEALRGSYIAALDMKYHVEHFTCAVCPTVFGPQDSYYEHEGKVYCHYHYSVRFAVKCSACRTAILKQFVEINRAGVDEHWHPECYMIHKFWNVKLALQDPASEVQISEGEDGAVSPSTMQQLKSRQRAMEEKVYQIWTVLSAFEESSAACISDMLLHVSNGAYIEGVRMADSFILHVEILFAALDDLERQLKCFGDDTGLQYTKEPKMLCKKIVNFFSLLSHTQETGVRRLGITQELLSLVTGLAHFLKILIRIALTAALKLERVHGSTPAIAKFLGKLMELADGDKPSRENSGSGRSAHAASGGDETDISSDLCVVCRVTIEEECAKYGPHRWHLGCLHCRSCQAPLSKRNEFSEAAFDSSVDGGVYCVNCRESVAAQKASKGFEVITQLQQYTFLLRVALIRLYTLLKVKVVDDGVSSDQETRVARRPGEKPEAVAAAAAAVASAGILLPIASPLSHPTVNDSAAPPAEGGASTSDSIVSNDDKSSSSGGGTRRGKQASLSDSPATFGTHQHRLNYPKPEDPLPSASSSTVNGANHVPETDSDKSQANQERRQNAGVLKQQHQEQRSFRLQQQQQKHLQLQQKQLSRDQLEDDAYESSPQSDPSSSVPRTSPRRLERQKTDGRFSARRRTHIQLGPGVPSSMLSLVETSPGVKNVAPAEGEKSSLRPELGLRARSQSATSARASRTSNFRTSSFSASLDRPTFSMAFPESDASTVPQDFQQGLRAPAGGNFRPQAPSLSGQMPDAGNPWTNSGASTPGLGHLSPSAFLPGPSTPGTISQRPGHGENGYPFARHLQQSGPTQEQQQQRPPGNPLPPPPDSEKPHFSRTHSSSGSGMFPISASVLTLRSHQTPFLSELSALELFIVRHLAVLSMAPHLEDQIPMDELLDLIGGKKPSLFSRVMESLKPIKKAGKVKGTFGVPLEYLTERGVDSDQGAGPGRVQLPAFFDEALAAMRGMDVGVEGIFRKNGNIKGLREVSERLDREPGSVNLRKMHPVQLAALLKKFLRELPDPILTFKLHRVFLATQQIEDDALRQKVLHLTCCLLPRAHRDALEALLFFLRWVAQFESRSKMGIYQLAAVIAPNMLKSKGKEAELGETLSVVRVVEELLESQDEFCTVPEDLAAMLHEHDLIAGSEELSTKDLLRRCENYVKLKKSHSRDFADVPSGFNHEPPSEHRQDPAHFHQKQQEAHNVPSHSHHSHQRPHQHASPVSGSYDPETAGSLGTLVVPSIPHISTLPSATTTTNLAMHSSLSPTSHPHHPPFFSSESKALPSPPSTLSSSVPSSTTSPRIGTRSPPSSSSSPPPLPPPHVTPQRRESPAGSSGESVKSETRTGDEGENERTSDLEAYYQEMKQSGFL